MPYITSTSREVLDPVITDLIEAFVGIAKRSNDTLTDGEITYIITRLLLSRTPAKYEDWARLIGILECVKLEMYRRGVAPYEDIKAEQNGDVYKQEMAGALPKDRQKY